MRPQTRRLMLVLKAAVAAIALTITLADRDLFRDAEEPVTLEGGAAWLTDHPADFLAATVVSDNALDANTPRRLQLWRAAYAHAKRLAPYRPNADAGFVRAGLFHWYELGPQDRARVRTAASPLLRDPGFFAQMLAPLWQLTRDFAWLHANAPETIDARSALRDLAVSRGLFGEYRVLREDLRARRFKQFQAQRSTGDPLALLSFVPERPTIADEPLVRGILEELDRRTFDPDDASASTEVLVDFAVRHDIQPLTGILPMLDLPEPLRDVTRARAALDLHNANAASRIEITSAVTGKPEWEAYFIDRAIFEARRHDANAAEAYLVRAAGQSPTMSLPLLAGAEEVANLLGNPNAAAQYRRQLEAHPKSDWTTGCATNELCDTASRYEYSTGKPLRVTLTTMQTDEIAPYVEVYVDDQLRAEAAIPDAKGFELDAPRGLHRVELRLVNRRTRNGTQRLLQLG